MVRHFVMYLFHICALRQKLKVSYNFILSYFNIVLHSALTLTYESNILECILLLLGINTNIT